MVDIITGYANEEVSRYEGNGEDDQKSDGTMPRIMAGGRLKLKAIAVSVLDDGRALEKLGDSCWDSASTPRRTYYTINWRPW